MTATTERLQRRIARVVDTPPPAPGFAGPGHTAVLVVNPDDFTAQDPFILLADDRVDFPEGQPIGSEHPHAGIEIATFVLEGAIHDRDEGVLRAGDVQWQLAGRGVIHNEHSVPEGHTRILQLWLTVREQERWSEPSFETIPRDAAPVRHERGVEARVYSGSSGGVQAQRHGHVPVTLVDISLETGASLEQDLPGSYNGFVYVLRGAVLAGETLRHAGQVGWLDRPGSGEGSALRLAAASAEGARVVLYAGEPQNVPIVMHGPFVGSSRADLMRISREYVAGTFPRMSALVRRPA